MVHISMFDHCLLSTAVIFLLLFVSAAAGSSLLQQEFVDQSKDQQRHLCGGMSDAVASSVAAPGLLERYNEINFTANNAIDNDKGTYFQSKEMANNSGSRVEWIRVFFSGLQREGGEVCGKYLRAVRLRNDKAFGHCDSTDSQNCFWVS